MKKYQIIYADPPWEMRYATGLKDGFHCLDVPYKQISLKDIKNLPIKNITDENAILFLWCIDTYLPNLQEIMNSWDFKYVTVGFVWNKIAANGGVNALVSQYTRKSCEFCYIGRKGKMLVKNPCSVDQYLGCIKGKHSSKPDMIRERIVKLCGDLPRVELFARKEEWLFENPTFKGWDCIGNEISGKDIRQELEEIINA